MKKRLYSELRKLSMLLLLGVAYYIFVTTTGFGIPCVFNLLTGLLCPACGISRMLISITKLDFYNAFGYNKLLFVSLPVMLLVFVLNEVKYVKTGDKSLNKLSKIIIICEIILLLVFGIIRNVI